MVAQVRGDVGVDRRTRGRRRRTSRPSRRRPRRARPARRGPPRTARPAPSPAAPPRRWPRTPRSVVGSAQRADPAGPGGAGPGRELEDVERGLLVRVGGAHRGDDRRAQPARCDHLDARLDHVRRLPGGADRRASPRPTGVNVPSPVDVHAHRVYSPTAPAPAAASASTRPRHRRRGRRRRACRAAPTVQDRAGPCARRPSASASASFTPPAAASALVCAAYSATPDRTSRCSRAPLNVVAATECTGAQQQRVVRHDEVGAPRDGLVDDGRDGVDREQDPPHGLVRVAGHQTDRVPGLRRARRVPPLQQPARRRPGTGALTLPHATGPSPRRGRRRRITAAAHRHHLDAEPHLAVATAVPGQRGAAARVPLSWVSGSIVVSTHRPQWSAKRSSTSPTASVRPAVLGERLEVAVDHEVRPEPPHVQRLRAAPAPAPPRRAHARRARRGPAAAHASSRRSEAVVVTCTGPVSVSASGSSSVPPCFSDIPRRAGSSSQTSRTVAPEQRGAPGVGLVARAGGGARAG